MAHVGSKYLSLTDLVNDWAAQSGELPLLTLRRICDWAVCGMFPDRTFLLPNGQQIDHLDLHRAMRLEMGVHAPIDRRAAGKLLDQAIVSKTGIQGYCEHSRVQPPPAMRPLKSRLFGLIAKPEHLGPPDCPNGALAAARLEARELAVAALRHLTGLITKVRRGAGRATAESEITAWKRHCADAHSSIETSDDAHLERYFAGLQDDWRTLTTLDGGANGAGDQPEQSDQFQSSPKKRRVGRPTGSGSLEREDNHLVDEMHADLVSRKHTSITAAARERVDRALGGGTEESKVKRLCTRYSERYPA